MVPNMKKNLGGYETAAQSQLSELVISGMAGKFPNSDNVHDFMRKLHAKVDLCQYNTTTVQHPELPTVFGYLNNFEKFDSGYFGMHLFQSQNCDPMSKMALEQAVCALMDAGIQPEELIGSRTGVFIGTCTSEYELNIYKVKERHSFLLPGTLRSMISHRISYFLKLNGPSFICDTACSSSMYALDCAYRAILEGRCDRAIVGGTNVARDNFLTLQFARLGVLNPGTGCRPFDNDAGGYTRSEGVATIIIQKRSEAKRIYANLVHINCNSDGYKPNGITFPSFDGQIGVLKDVYEESNIDPKQVGFVEAHGTGTIVGDPEELSVIDSFFKPTLERPLLIGSVKGNIGHNEPSAGVCAIIKVASALSNGQIAPNINYKTPREGVGALADGRLKVVTAPTPFPEDLELAAVNCFGFGGSNSHLILSRAKEPRSATSVRKTRLICYSGRNKNALNMLHEHVQTSKNAEFLGLLQESFKVPIENHLFRGFSIVGTDVRSTKLVKFYKIPELFVIFGNYSSLCSLDNLSEIPLLRKIYKEVTVTDENVPAEIIMYAFMMKALAELSITPRALNSAVLSSEFEKNFKNGLNMAEVIQVFQSQLFHKCKNSQELYLRKNSTILVFGHYDKIPQSSNIVHFNDNMTSIDFLFNVGRLYEDGFNPKISNLYDPMTYPVNCSTEISHLIGWNHISLKLHGYDKFLHAATEKVECLKCYENPEVAFYRGHLIDNRNLFPATGYLWHLWELFADSNNSHPHIFNVYFQNVRFHRAYTITAKAIDLHMMIRRSGKFEVAENNSVIVSGYIFKLEASEDKTSTIMTNDKEAQKFKLNSKDIYKELRIRGYNYKGIFRGLQEVNSNKATIKWENWVTFLDNMMQVCILQKDSRSLFVPVGIGELKIMAKEHMQSLENYNEKMVPVEYSSNSESIRSKYVEMRNLQATSILKRKNILKPVLESYQFVPNEYNTDLSTSMRINMQILLECKTEINLPILEVLEMDDELLLSQEICTVLEDMPLVLPKMSVLTAKSDFAFEYGTVINTITDRYLLYIRKNAHNDIWAECEKALVVDGFLLCFCLRSYNFDPPANFILLTTHFIDGTNNVIYFLRKKLDLDSKPEIVNISNLEPTWLNKLQQNSEQNKYMVLLSQNVGESGIIGLTNCLRRERSGENIQCVFIQDVTSPSLNFMTQVDKQMAINVYQNGQWGTYRHLLLPKVQNIEAFHWFATARNPGELSSISWWQGPITKNEFNKIKPIKVLYAALNFRDLMIVSGKLTPEVVSLSRLTHHKLNGLEFSGIDSNGTRVVGMCNGSLSNYVEDPVLHMNVPDDWELDDAATAFVVYATVLLAFSNVETLHKGQSILIHSATGGVGLSALNVCTYHQLNIFVTVGSEEKRAYLLAHYPNLKAAQIGNSRDISFKEMIRRETNGRGVDIVLNSLAEDKMYASIECIANGGYFLEIGKYDMAKNNELSIEVAKRQVSYYSVMLDYFLKYKSQHEKDNLKSLLSEAMRKGYMKPLPKKVFQIDELEKAFKFMSTGRHIGKLLIEIDHNRVNKHVMPCIYFHPTYSYIIFGGLGGFGLELADWLVLRGARNLILSSRSGITTGYQDYRISIWKSYGANIIVSTEDTTTYDNCYKVLKRIHARSPVDGIFNLAVVLKDSVFKNQTMESMKISMLPKATMTAFLDKATRELCPNMSHFVVFSSVSCGRGNAGQTNYGYSNSIMERICEKRCKDGFSGLAIQWGAVGDVGLLEDLQKEQNEIAIGGTLQQKIGNCLQVLDELMMAKTPIVSSMLVAAKFGKSVVDSPQEAVRIILGIADMKSVSPHATFPELGMDSMMAVEIRQTLERDFDIVLGPNDLRSLTFIALEDLSENNAKNVENLRVNEDLLMMLLPNMSCNLSQLSPLLDFNIDASKTKGDFVLVFTGIDCDFSKYDKIALKINRHIKCVNIDAISKEYEKIDIVADYIVKALADEVLPIKRIAISAHSIGCIPAIETANRFEDMGVHVKVVFIDSSPRLVMRLFGILKADCEEDFHYNVLLNVLTTILPSPNTSELKEILAKGKDFQAKVDIALKYYTTIETERMDVSRSMALDFMAKLLSVQKYNPRHDNKLQSDVILYKPNIKPFRDLAEDYGLSTIFTEVNKIAVFDGNHHTILENEKMMEQLALDLSFNTS